MGCQLSQTACYLFSDNLAVVAVIQLRSTRDPILLHLLQCLYFYVAYQFTYVACHVSRWCNVAADALSRDYISLFHSLVPKARQMEMSSSVLDLLVFQQPDRGSPDWISLFRASFYTSSLQALLRPTAQQ